ncbi:MAG: hypothetical protein HC910_09605 [Spirulinaceae cyanobacterium SM2_1_0]|nr:hypothetical protein [Spirulinaceae cyanobacterium SM2_1_0]
MNQRDRAFYWQFVVLNVERGSQRQEIATARQFFTTHFAPLALSDTAITRQLYHTWQTDPEQPQPSAAELCLRCYISNHIAQACWQLAERFGKAYGFGSRDLLPLVLTDVALTTSLRPLVEAESEQRDRCHVPLAAEILRTYEPERGSLSAWISRLVGQHRELNDCLLSYGVYLISDWAILNDTPPHRLTTILALSAAEVESDQALLSSYHAVYRRDRSQPG